MISKERSCLPNVRFLYGEVSKKDKWFNDLKDPEVSGQSQHVKASGKYFAYAARSGGESHLIIHDLSSAGNRSPTNSFCSSISNGKNGRITDFDFSPVNDNLIAFGTDSAKISVVTVPIKNATQSNDECTMSGNPKYAMIENNLYNVHKKKVTLVQFHPCVESILATTSMDGTVKLTDIETKQNIVTVDTNIENHSTPERIYSMAWNRNGSLISVTNAEKKLMIFDPRIFQKSIINIDSFTGKKPR